MKKFLYAAVALASIGNVCCSGKSGSGSLPAEMSESTALADDSVKTLVLYFSATGVTAREASRIADITGGILQEIAASPAYTAANLDWTDKSSRCYKNMVIDKHSRPAIAPVSVDASGYDIIYLGYPIWWNLAPHEVYTYVETGALDGKKVVPFATSGGSTIDNSVADLKATYPDVVWQAGKLLDSPSRQELAEWLASTRK